MKLLIIFGLLPREHALAIASNGFKEEEVGGIGAVLPIAEDVEFCLPSDELVGADEVGLGAEGTPPTLTSPPVSM
jgi:hypothetical protein